MFPQVSYVPYALDLGIWYIMNNTSKKIFLSLPKMAHTVCLWDNSAGRSANKFSIFGQMREGAYRKAIRSLSSARRYWSLRAILGEGNLFQKLGK
jgi:hypothetical protein